MFTAAGTFACSFEIPSKDLHMRMEFQPDNQFDSNAVVLLLNNQKVGYVPMTRNKLINPSTSFIKDWKIKVWRGGEIKFIITTLPLAKEDKEKEMQKEDKEKEMQKEDKEKEMQKEDKEKEIIL